MNAPTPHEPHPWFKTCKAWHYNLIMADPAWTHETWSEAGQEKSPQAQYDCMDLDAIKSMPVRELTSENCILWLWATNPMLPQAIEVLNAWGFTYCTAGHWVKRTVNGKLHFGTGRVLRCSGEPFLIGTIGKPATANNVRSVIEGLVREHSRKPDEAYETAEALRFGPYADLFSRQRRKGWDSWGDEADKFDEVA